MKRAAKKRDQEQLEGVNAFLKKAIELYKEKGVNVHISTPEELAKFKEKMLPVYEWWIGKVSDGQKYIEFTKAHH
jgi:TRAP-type C4-dicarboxylate transport system substrate-binding protein